MKKALSLILIAGCFGATCYGADKTSAVPVLVELFTSEGCSSCPPADAWLLQLDSLQPVPGAHLIVLSEHVDYWDHDGWKDPYSSALATERQVDYSHVFKLQGPATPQVVVDGTANMNLSDSQDIRHTFETAVATPMINISISSATVTAGNPPILHAQVEVDGASVDHKADIYEAVALNHAESQVLHGENGGKHLTHAAVVEQLTKIGKVEKGKNFSKAIEIKLKPGTDPKSIRLVIFAQEPGPGKVLGAAMQGSLE